MEIGPESVTEYEEGIAKAMENVRNHDSHYLLLCANNDVTSLLLDGFYTQPKEIEICHKSA